VKKTLKYLHLKVLATTICNEILSYNKPESITGMLQILSLPPSSGIMM
jgi:hypothetical protein